MNKHLPSPPATGRHPYLPVFTTIITNLKTRYLKSVLYKDHCVIKYKTTGGYYTKATYSKTGNCLRKEYFRNYDESSGKLSGYLFYKDL
ncbi:MAG: hypothetical protein ACM3VS_07015 [Candidatus Dadabacteria bacterium]